MNATAAAAPDRSSAAYAQSVADEMLRAGGRPWSPYVEEFVVEPYADSEGEDAFHVFVLTAKPLKDSEPYLTVMIDLVDAFREAGVVGWPYHRVMTRDDYEHLGDVDE